MEISFLAEFANIMVEFCGNVGITDLGDSKVKKKCLEIMSKYYYHLSLENIEMAFDMVILGRLEIDYSHFGRLTPVYISNILRAYSQVLRRRQTPKKAIQADNSNHNAKMKEFIEDELKQFQSSGKLNIRNYNTLYDYMEKNGMFTITDDHQKAIENYVRNEYFPGSTEPITAVGEIMAKLKDEYSLDKTKLEYYKKRQMVIEQFKIWRDK